MKLQKIRTKLVGLSQFGKDHHFELSGWLGNVHYDTYLRFSIDGHFVGTLEGQSLYRLAKAIVRRFEEGG